jgi:hypothetical protein
MASTIASVGRLTKSDRRSIGIFATLGGKRAMAGSHRRAIRQERSTRPAVASVRQGAMPTPQLPMTTLVTPCHEDGVTAPSQQIRAS